MPLRRRHAIVCRRAVELVTDYLEGVLSEGERARFELHLDACPHCARYLEQVRATVAAAGRLDPGAVDPEVREELVALYRRWRTG